MDDDELQDMLKQNMKFNIIFTVGQPGMEEEEDETSEEEEEEDEEDDSKQNAKKKYTQFKKNQTVRVEHKDWDKAYNGIIKAVVDLKNNPAYSLYNVELEEENEEEWALQENIKGNFLGSVEVEIFSARDMVFPYPAITLSYVSELGNTFVHTCGRIFNDLSDLEENNDEVLKFFEIVEKINISLEQRNLIKLKKALYFKKISRDTEGNKLLEEIIADNSIWKETALEISK